MANRLSLADAIVAAAYSGKVPAELTALDSVAAGATIASGTTAATIADASVTHDLNAVFDDTEVEAALNALGTKINSILAALEAFNITASA